MLTQETTDLSRDPYYSIFGLFPTYLTKDLHLSPALVGLPLILTNATTFVASFLWG